ncbi:MAG: hypothetical protein M1826_007473 [Phylliscum demangeonii]|nr:MAG: hypothetical protein M1826_007473 [Phylliscum demangeonii]
MDSGKVAASGQSPSTLPESSVHPATKDGGQTLEQTTDVPPIIAYPEFLVRPTSARPLVEARHVVYTAYIAGSVFATAYGTSKYILSPMLQLLGEARQSLATTALTNLKDLNERLERTVSEVPITLQRTAAAAVGSARKTDGDRSEATLSDSDPTELFHVDAGTQTSPMISRAPSPSSDTSPPSVDKLGALASQEMRLKEIFERLVDVAEVDRNAGETDRPLAAGIQKLSAYLDSVIESSSAHRSPYDGVHSGAVAGLRKGDQRRISIEESVASIKSEIRGIKGTLLSAKTFPAGSARSGPRTVVH